MYSGHTPGLSVCCESVYWAGTHCENDGPTHPLEGDRVLEWEGSLSMKTANRFEHHDGALNTVVSACAIANLLRCTVRILVDRFNGFVKEDETVPLCGVVAALLWDAILLLCLSSENLCCGV